MKTRDKWLLGTCFFFSGATTLVLEVAWSKELSYILGTTLYSISTVVAAFMAGLGIGSAIASLYAAKVKRPVLSYALIQCAIAVFGALSIPVFRATEPIFQSLYQYVDPGAGTFLMARFLIVFSLMLVPAALMGMTLPVVVGAFARQRRIYAFEAGLLYGLNTLGAVMGTLAAGFFLLPWLGLLKTCILAAAVDSLVAVMAFAINRRVNVIEDIRNTVSPTDSIPVSVHPSSSKRIRSRVSGPAGTWSTYQWIIGSIFAMSGAIAMIYEVGWFRLLSMTIGPTVYAFSAMLGMFLLGIGAGSAIASKWAERTPLGGIRAMAVLEGLLGIVSIAGMYFINGLPWAISKIFVLFTEFSGIEGFAISQIVLSAFVVLPPCFLMGALFPVAVRAIREAGDDVAPETNVGRLYVMNTVGAIIGSLAAGFYLIPSIGMWAMLITAGIVSVALSIALWMLSAEMRWRTNIVTISAIASVTVVLTWAAPDFNTELYNRGYYRQIYYGDKVHLRSNNKQLIYYREGINCPVAVFNEGGYGSLRVTGKVDASTGGADLSNQLLLGHLPVLFSDNPRYVGFIGYGSGMSVMASLTHPGVESVDIMEIEEAVIGASPYFETINHNSLKDPRSRLIMEDGRIHVVYTNRNYDVIVSEPSNPWIAGISNLFTVDFYHRVKKALSPKGIFAQWIQLYEISPEAVRTILASMREVFPHMAVFQVYEHDIIVLASSQQIRIPYKEFHSRFDNDKVKESLRRINIINSHQLLSSFIAADDQLDAFIAEAPSLNTDDNVWLEYRMPRDIFWSGKIKIAGGIEDPAYLIANLGASHRLRFLQAMLPGLSLSETMCEMLRYFQKPEPAINGSEVLDLWVTGRSAFLRGMVAATENLDDHILSESFKECNSQESEYLARRIQASRLIATSAGIGKGIQRSIAQQALSIAPDLSVALTLVGNIAQKDGNYTEAMAHYSRVLENPSSSYYYYALNGMGDVSVSIGEIEKAADYYNQAIAHNPYLTKAFLGLATIYSRQGNSEKLHETLQNALRFNPDDQGILRALHSLKNADSREWWSGL